MNEDGAQRQSIKQQVSELCQSINETQTATLEGVLIKNKSFETGLKGVLSCFINMLHIDSSQKFIHVFKVEP